jgi:hypothetical protein
MRTYEKVTTGYGSELIKATEGERTLWIPLDPANSDYAEYLRYTEWVEAGNDPSEFWTQSEGEI